MKNHVLRSVFGLALVAFVFSGCDKLDEVGEVTFNAEFTLPDDFHVDEDADNPDNPYISLNSSIEAEQDPQVQVYKDKIKKITVNKVKYEIHGFNAPGAVTLVNGTATFFEVGGSASSGVVATVTNLPLGNKSGDLTVNADGLKKIGDILLEDGEVMVVSVATLSDSPAEFYITVTLDVTITANALE